MIPYVYHIKWTNTGMNYIGCRYANGCNPQDLWESYFTSSEYVSDYRKSHGEPDQIRILKTFIDPLDCLKWENRILIKVDAMRNNSFLNMSNGNKSFLMTEDIKEKIRSTLTGVKHSDERKKNISESLKGRKIPKETIEKFVKSRTGKTTRKKGMIVGPCKESTKEKIGNKNRGKLTVYDRTDKTLKSIPKELYWENKENYLTSFEYAKVKDSL